MAKFVANADYEERDSDPLVLKAGDVVRLGGVDEAWPGWVWASDESGKDGYVPERIISRTDAGHCTVNEDFDPAVLTIRRGETLESLRQIHGWHWCRKETGEQGWVAGYLLRPVAGNP